MALRLLPLLVPAVAVAARPLYMDPAQPVPARVADLLSRMTLEEKVAQVSGVSVQTSVTFV
jgi:beta-glucosidase